MDFWVLPVCRISLMLTLMSSTGRGVASQTQSAYFLPEFALSPQGSFLEDTTGEQYLTYRYDDQSSRTTRSDEERDTGWDAWGAWSDCSRTCGGGASYSLRRCLNGGNCEGRNIRYRTCSNTDCPQKTGIWSSSIKTVIEVPMGSRGLRITAKGSDMIAIKTVIEVPMGSRGLRITAKGSDMIVNLGSPQLKYAGPKDTVMQFMFYQPIRYQWRETDFFPCSVTCGGGYQLNSADCMDIRYNKSVAEHLCHSFPENTKPTPKLKECNMDPCLESDGFKEVMPYDQYQPLPRWEQNPWTSCSVSCGGGSQERSVVCVEEDIHGQIVQVEDWKCAHSPRPISKESCNTFECPQWMAMEWSQIDVEKKWEQNPWTSCSVSCGGGSQERSVVCVEEDIHGQIVQVEDWKCAHSPRPISKESCNTFECPQWMAMEWSQCTVTCGPGLRYRVVLCVDHSGQHTGGCSPHLKPHIKEDCLVPVACHKPR
ncbi:ADAMTS-like protein 3, partial [Sinocyclocheilus grahami]|uniref:ADAMTS-like protein 3 n=1 Tax=Sinocyclocheilus grahami TaxID=75366 RepID=UPI0007AD5E44